MYYEIETQEFIVKNNLVCFAGDLHIPESFLPDIKNTFVGGSSFQRLVTHKNEEMQEYFGEWVKQGKDSAGLDEVLEVAGNHGSTYFTGIVYDILIDGGFVNVTHLFDEIDVVSPKSYAITCLGKVDVEVSVKEDFLRGLPLNWLGRDFFLQSDLEDSSYNSALPDDYIECLGDDEDLPKEDIVATMRMVKEIQGQLVMADIVRIICTFSLPLDAFGALDNACKHLGWKMSKHDFGFARDVEVAILSENSFAVVDKYKKKKILGK